jgi:hypothetical protein
MKNKIKFIGYLVAIFLFSGTVMLASFPVKTEKTENAAEENVVITKNNINKKIQTQFNTYVKSDNAKTTLPESKVDDMLILLILWFFLWPIAAHRWYKQKPLGYNILFILTFGGCGIWAIVDLVNIIQEKF